jgi:ABC-type Mn2+/Zn2+ transport system ATPase subunit
MAFVNQSMPKTEAAVLTVRDLCVRYNGVVGIDSLSFEVFAGERIAVIGPNGAGKSSLMKAIMGLVIPNGGAIELRRPLGYVPQQETINWDFPVTLRDAVMMGRTRLVGWLRWPGRDQWQTVDEALARVDLLALADRPVGSLSGGQRRRMFIARALAQEAEILILDEPFSGVDVHAQGEIMEVLDKLQQEGITILLSTHDLGLAFRRFDRVLALRQRLIAYGTAEEIYVPEVLEQLYGGKLAVLDGGLTVVVDDHGC